MSAMHRPRRSVRDVSEEVVAMAKKGKKKNGKKK